MEIIFPLLSRSTGKIDSTPSLSYVKYFPGWGNIHCIHVHLLVVLQDVLHSPSWLVMGIYKPHSYSEDACIKCLFSCLNNANADGFQHDR